MTVFLHIDRRSVMDNSTAVMEVLDEVLGLRGRGADWTQETALLGSVPELDSMAVVSLLTALSERFGFELDDDIDGADFATLGALTDFVHRQQSCR
jgi:acyl carrier protein